jgi:small subunit ribosomal protein S7
MPRKGHIAKRDVLVDPIYNSKLVTRLINKIMIDGKRGTAQKILYNAFDIVEVKTGKQPMEVFEEALENVMPQLELKARRVGGANYQVPVEVSDELSVCAGLLTMPVCATKKQWNSALLRRSSMRQTTRVPV